MVVLNATGVSPPEEHAAPPAEAGKGLHGSADPQRQVEVEARLYAEPRREVHRRLARTRHGTLQSWGWGAGDGRLGPDDWGPAASGGALIRRAPSACFLALEGPIEGIGAGTQRDTRDEASTCTHLRPPHN